MLKLAAAGWEAVLLPVLGGAIGALRYAGQDVLRPTPDDATDPLDSACFPLVPYANRIAGGRFAFDGRIVTLPRNFGEHPHSLHGLGWHRAWEVLEGASDRARIRHRHDGGGGWPWRYRAEQLFVLGVDGLNVTLSVANESEAPMPAGLGLHPYFRVSPRTVLRFGSGRVWLADPAQLPTHDADADHFGDWHGGAVMAGRDLVDNAYERWDGNASLDGGDRTIRLVAEGARDLHLCIPVGGSFCCVEPVTHLPDAFNRPGGLFDVLPAGGSMTLRMRISVETGGAFE